MDVQERIVVNISKIAVDDIVNHYNYLFELAVTKSDEEIWKEGYLLYKDLDASKREILISIIRGAIVTSVAELLLILDDGLLDIYDDSEFAIQLTVNNERVTGLSPAFSAHEANKME